MVSNRNRIAKSIVGELRGGAAGNGVSRGIALTVHNQALQRSQRVADAGQVSVSVVLRLHNLAQRVGYLRQPANVVVGFGYLVARRIGRGVRVAVGVVRDSARL